MQSESRTRVNAFRNAVDLNPLASPAALRREIFLLAPSARHWRWRAGHLDGDVV